MPVQFKEHLIYKGEDYYYNPQSSSPQSDREDIFFTFRCSQYRGKWIIEDQSFTFKFAQYRGKWIIEDNKLYLVSLQAFIDGREVGLDYLFSGEDKIFADWITGEICLSYYKMVENVHQKEDSSPDKKLERKIRAGMIMEGWERDLIHSTKSPFGVQEHCKKKICRVIFTCRPSWLELVKSKMYDELFSEE